MLCEIKSEDKIIHHKLHGILIANLFNDDTTKDLIKECFGLERVGDFMVNDNDNKYVYHKMMSN